MPIIKIGVECENLEDPKSRWGVGRITFNLLREYAISPEWQKKYRLYLYFKNRVPDDEIFKNPVFIKRILGFPSFNIFYHILMPLRAMADRLDWMFFPAYMLPPLYLKRSAVVLTDDVYYEYKYGDLPFRYKLAYRLFTNWAAKKAAKIMAISETSKKNLVTLYGIRPEKIFVDYLGIGTANNKPETVGRRQMPNPYLLSVGQMFPRRHAKEIILAFEKLASGSENLSLILIGPDKYPEPVINLLASRINERLGRQAVIREEHIEDRELAELYVGAKALVYISDREAFGLPPMEALSFGIPPIVMDNELGHELFGEYAFYAKSGGIDDIAEAVKTAMSDEQKINRIKSEGPEFVKKYNWKSFTDNFLKNIENEPA